MKMQIDNIIWLPHTVDKLAWKHHVTPPEVEEILFDSPMYRKVQKGNIPDEDLYAALDRPMPEGILLYFSSTKLQTMHF